MLHEKLAALEGDFLLVLAEIKPAIAADVAAAGAFVSLTEDEPAIIELAAWTSLARVLMNTDEFVTRN